MIARSLVAALLLLLTAAVAHGQPEAKRLVAAMDPDGVQRVEMVGGEYYFSPAEVVVKVNVPVELKVRSAGGIAPHDIVLRAPEAGIDFAEELGSQAKSIRFTPTRAGRYPFACSKRFLFFPSHKERGMHGVLEVVE